MRLIHERGNISTRELAAYMKTSNGAAYYILHSLIEKGYVRAENIKIKSKKSGYFYLFTSAGLSEKARLTVKFIRRKKDEYLALQAEIEALEQECAETNVQLW